MPSKCAVLVNSCDKYEDAWHPFFRLFDIMWPECPYDVYLNTETKECSEILHGGAVKTLHPSKTKCSWSKRLKDVLRQLDADYVITLLEDFFIMSPVRHDIIQQGLNIMDNDGNLMGIELYANPHLDVPYERDFAEIDDTFMYCISTMAWIWRKEYLLSILRNENAWDFELYSSLRYRYHRNPNVKIITPIHCRVLDYTISPGCGYGIYQGKWLNKNRELFEKHGIEADFSKRDTIIEDVVCSFNSDNGESRSLVSYFSNIKNEPKQLWHYVQCLGNIVRFKFKSFLARYLNM